jgi:hypothetical protein
MVVREYSHPTYEWLTTSGFSAKRLANIEDQMEDGEFYLDTHDHDSSYYTKAQSDAKYYYTAHMDGFDADKLDGSHGSTIMEAILPVGAVVPWAGSESEIPTGWAICDGNNTTPDLRDRFVIGAGSTYTLGQTCGVSSKSVASGISLQGATVPLAAHTHTLYDTTMSTSNAGKGPGGYYYKLFTPTTSSRTTGSTGSNQAHTHDGVVVSSAEWTDIHNWYCLIYIMKVS